MEKEDKLPKTSFFKRIIESIRSFEKYSTFAQEKSKTAILYVLKLIACFSIITTICFIIQLTKNNITQYLYFDNIYINYILIFVITYIVLLISYFLATLIDILILALIGYITAKFLKIKLEFKKVYNISSYAITFPIVINGVYFIINALTNFTIKYFQVMYIAIAYIYIITAIFIIKSENIKTKSN